MKNNLSGSGLQNYITMDLESLTNLRDKRNRFQVNRVDSVVTGNHSPGSPSGGSSGTVGSGATLLAYKDYGNGTSNGNGTRGDGNLELNFAQTSHSQKLYVNPLAHLSMSESCGYPQRHENRGSGLVDIDDDDESISDADDFKGQ